MIKDGEKFLVIKVNAKSFYLAKGISLKKFNDLLSVKSKGETFKQFCDRNNFKMHKYDGFEIFEEDEKTEIPQNILDNKFNYADTDYLNQSSKMILAAVSQENGFKRFQNIQTDDGIMRVIDVKDNDKILLNVDSNYVLYNMKSDSSYKLCSVYDWNTKLRAVPWEKV